MDVVNEKSTYVVTVSFKDEDKVAVSPATANYSVYDVDSKVAVVEQTDISALSSSVDLTFSSSVNSILDPKKLVEKRLLTVQFTYSNGKSGVGQYQWVVKNLLGVV